MIDELRDVVCFCPSSRFAVATLVLSSWPNVQRFVFTEDPSRDPGGFSAAIVMDRFVTKELVERLSTRLLVIVLAWNGLFEIHRYREELGDAADVLYLGTDETLATDAVSGAIRYLPFINGACPFRSWLDSYRTKSRFHVEGGVRYRGRWLRTRMLPLRPLSVLVAATGSIKRPDMLVDTLRSSVISDKLVWAGNCYLDFSSLGLNDSDRRFLETSIHAVQSTSDSAQRLTAGLELIRSWRQRTTPQRAHEMFYVTNTLLRWAALDFLIHTNPSATWFFGKDNLGLGLKYELYVHNLVGSERVAFIEFGGKTSETNLYPRSLFLLARQYYVIPIDGPESAAGTLEELRRGLARGHEEFFQVVERRRHDLYKNLPSGCELRDTRKQVWLDFEKAGPW